MRILQQNKHMHPLYLRKRRRTIVLGVLVVGGGMAGIVLPVVPGLALILVGLSLLSSQSRTAHRTLAYVRARYQSVAEPLERFETWLNDTLDLTTHTREFFTVPRKGGGMIDVYVEASTFRAGVALLLHSLSGVKESPVMDTIAEYYRARGYTVVRFDAYHGMGGEGPYAAFSVAEYLADLESVVAWATEQVWWQEPRALGGHSLGGLVAAEYAAAHPDLWDELLLVAPTVSGASYAAALEHTPDLLQAWRERGVREVHHPLTDAPYELPYSFVEDTKQYDLVAIASSLRLPVRVVVGTDDHVAPAEDVQTFARACAAVTTVVPGMPHTPVAHHELAALGVALRGR